MRRVVITGVGVVAPGGLGKEAFWSLLTSGSSACDTITLVDDLGRFRSHMAGEVQSWDPSAHGLSEDECATLDRHIQFALVAAAEAWQDAGLIGRSPDPYQLGVAVGTAIGSSSLLEREYFVVSRGATDFNLAPDLAASYLFTAFTPSSLSATVASRVGAHGPVVTISSGCTAGMDAVAQGVEWIRQGDATMVLAGGSEAGICPINMASFDLIKATSPRNEEPRVASRPFDGSRNGFVLAEGCAFLLLEDFEAACARGARIYAEIRGYGSAMNAFHMTGLPAHGLDMVQAIRAALDDAGVAPGEIQYINAHGSSTPQNDLHETNAFKMVWGEAAYQVPVSSIKSMVGHSLGAIGAIELVACALCLERASIPPTINYTTPDPACDLDYVPNVSRAAPLTSVISTASGFGGFQSAMVLSKVR